MIFEKTSISGVYIISIEKQEDDRGFFARIWDKEIFQEKELNTNIVQCSISSNKKKGTWRGFHIQHSPYEEAKIIRCTQGKMFDIVLDLRNDSLTFKKWFSIEISAENHKMLYVPEGCANGFQTLEDNTEAVYEITQVFKPKSSGGVRWDDPALGIKLPLPISKISKKDTSWNFL
jgi:dTDP-4-dehydrorhamnose 3,5-epimerase